MSHPACSICGKVGSGARADNKWFCDDCLNSPARTRGRKVPVKVVEDDAATIKRLQAEVLALKSRVADKAFSDDKVIFGKVIIRDESEEGPIQLLEPDVDRAPVSAQEIEKAKEEAAHDTRVYTPTNEKTLKRIGAAITDEKPESKPASSARAEKPAAADKKPRAASRGAKRSSVRKARR